jgi:hypothetical protein
MLSGMPIRSGTLSSFVVLFSLAERFQSFTPLRGKQSPARKSKHLAAAG